jgi:tRNA threonylcarbamoyladenosine biosynthesis protein TsaE
MVTEATTPDTAMHMSSHSPEQTREFASALGRLLSPGDFIALIGPLGAGKTAFVQGLATGLGIRDTVSSPTFVIMRYHRGATPLCHVDAYRVSEAEALEEIGVLDMLESGVVAVEWADSVPDLWPQETLIVELRHPPQDSDCERELRLTGRGERPTRIVTALREGRGA